MKIIITSLLYFIISQVGISQELTFSPLDTNAMYKIVEEMPQFPGCEELATREAKRTCTNQKMLEFIYDDIHFSNKDCAAGCYTATILFTVEKNGKLTDFKLQSEKGTKLEKAVLEAAKKLPDFIPGKQRGYLVKVQLKLPIRILLE